MFSQKKPVVLIVCVMLLSNLAFAELSSKAKKAEKLASSGKIAEAVEIYKELMAKDHQKNADLVKEGFDGMANCLLIGVKDAFSAKKYYDAKKGAEDILAKYRDTSSVNEAAKYLGMSQLELSRSLIDDKKYNDAIDQLKAVKEKMPSGNSQLINDINKQLSTISCTLLKLGQENIKTAKCDDAMKNLNLALASSTDNEGSALCKYSIGVCFRLNKQNDKAISTYQEVISNYTGTNSVALAYADMYLLNMDLGNKDEALNDIKQAVSLKPGSSDYLFKEAVLFYELQKNDDAQKAAKKLIPVLQAEIDKTYLGKENLQYKLGMSKLILENYTEAAVEFDKALTRNPDMLDTRKSLALSQFKDKNYSGALITYDELIKRVSTLFDDATDKASKDKDSNELAKKVEDLRKDIAYFHYQKGLSYEALGTLDKAEAECRLGLEGVSTEEAAATLKRIQAAQAAAPKKEEPKP